MIWHNHIATRLCIGPDAFGYSPFLVTPTCPSKPRRSWKPCEGGAQRGGLGRAHQPVLRSFSEVGLFGDKLLALLEDLNQTLAA
jgi:hypothetical protein